MFYVYVLKSVANGKLYKGFTQDLEERVRRHNLGKVRSTKGYVPWKLVYFEVVKTREEARTKEKYFKSGSGREFLKIKLAQ